MTSPGGDHATFTSTVGAFGFSPFGRKGADIRHAIEQALARQAKRHAQRVQLEVHNGRVSLSGHVDSWAEREGVGGAAKGTTGVLDRFAKLLIAPLPIAGPDGLLV